MTLRRVTGAPVLLALALLACGGPDPADPADHADEVATCDPAAALPAQLRLLTRREYAATVNDLFGFAAAAQSCEATPDCDLSAQSCLAGVCTEDPCTTVSFVLDGFADASSVFVSGDFNGWPSAGGLSLERAGSRWWAKTNLDEGAYAYKLVVDGAWIADPANPDTVSDGYGGQNSVLTVSCDGEADDALTAGFPVESRPDEFPFDDFASDALVTAAAAAAHLDAAARVASRALDAPGAWLPCDPDAANCLGRFLDEVAPRVLRRPLSSGERARYAALGAAGEGPRDGLSLVLEAMLASPLFLYRSEIGDGATLDPYEAATALSYALWGSTPDDALLAAAADGSLSTPEGRRAQAVRLLTDVRARAHIGAFAVQWLGVSVMETAAKSEALYGPVSPALRQAMQDEAAAFTAHVLFDGSRTVAELYTADYTFANADLAALYGLSAPEAGFVQVDWPAGRQAGVLGLSGVLASLAHSDQSSPVQRGAWVRQRLLCQPLPPPPANVPAPPEASEEGSTRQRFEQHTSDPTCAGCHEYLDPVGFGFEHFDAMGRWRDTDAGLPVDASGAVKDLERRGAGTTVSFDGLPALGAILAGSPAAERCLVTQLGRFAAGVDTQSLCLTDTAAAQYQTTGDLRQALLTFVTDDAFYARELP